MVAILDLQGRGGWRFRIGASRIIPCRERLWTPKPRSGTMARSFSKPGTSSARGAPTWQSPRTLMTAPTWRCGKIRDPEEAGDDRLAERFAADLNDVAARGGDGPRRLQPDPGRARVGQDAGDHLSGRLPDRQGGPARVDPAGDVHPPGGPRDGRPARDADRPAGRRGSGPGRSTISAIACSGARPGSSATGRTSRSSTARTSSTSSGWRWTTPASSGRGRWPRSRPRSSI